MNFVRNPFCSPRANPCCSVVGDSHIMSIKVSRTRWRICTIIDSRWASPTHWIFYQPCSLRPTRLKRGPRKRGRFGSWLWGDGWKRQHWSTDFHPQKIISAEKLYKQKGKYALFNWNMVKYSREILFFLNKFTDSHLKHQKELNK